MGEQMNTDSRETSALLQCPFCGGSFQSLSSNGIDNDFVVCECGAEGPPREGEQQASEAWNFRPFSVFDNEKMQIERIDAENHQLRQANKALAKEAHDWHSALTLTIAQKGAWKEVAEDQYGKLRAALYGPQGDYPVLGALDAYAAGRHPVLKLPTMRGDE